MGGGAGRCTDCHVWLDPAYAYHLDTDGRYQCLRCGRKRFRWWEFAGDGLWFGYDHSAKPVGPPE